MNDTTADPRAPLLLPIERALRRADQALSAAIARQDFKRINEIREQIIHLETKLQNARNGLYDSLLEEVKP